MTGHVGAVATHANPGKRIADARGALELGRQDETWVEVLSGLKPGVQYVAENSYLIKADIEKSGASHEH